MDSVNLPDVLVYGMPVTVIAPVVVQGLKNAGLATKWAGIASIVVCLLLLLGAGLVTGEMDPDDLGRYIAFAVAYGLAGSGLYSQTKLLTSGDGRGPASSP